MVEAFRKSTSPDYQSATVYHAEPEGSGEVTPQTVPRASVAGPGPSTSSSSAQLPTTSMKWRVIDLTPVDCIRCWPLTNDKPSEVGTIKNSYGWLWKRMGSTFSTVWVLSSHLGQSSREEGRGNGLQPLGKTWSTWPPIWRTWLTIRRQQNTRRQRLAWLLTTEPEVWIGHIHSSILYPLSLS